MLRGEPVGTAFLPAKIAAKGKKKWLLAVPIQGEIGVDRSGASAVLRGMPLLTSHACALPGIVSVQDGAHELVESRVSGLHLADPESVESLRLQLEEALALPEETRLAWGTASRAAVLPLTWEGHLDRWTEVIEALDGRGCDTVH